MMDDPNLPYDRNGALGSGTDATAEPRTSWSFANAAKIVHRVHQAAQNQQYRQNAAHAGTSAPRVGGNQAQDYDAQTDYLPFPTHLLPQAALGPLPPQHSSPWPAPNPPSNPTPQSSYLNPPQGWYGQSHNASPWAQPGTQQQADYSHGQSPIPSPIPRPQINFEALRGQRVMVVLIPREAFSATLSNITYEANSHGTFSRLHFQNGK
jgi:hypothetical protein